MFGNIIWDVDGTLFDTYPAISKAFQAALNDFGKEASLDWIEGLAKTFLGHCVAVLANQFKLDEEHIVQAFGEYYDHLPPEEQPSFSGALTICEYIYGVGGNDLPPVLVPLTELVQLVESGHRTVLYPGSVPQRSSECNSISDRNTLVHVSPVALMQHSLAMPVIFEHTNYDVYGKVFDNMGRSQTALCW